jgi:diguanylate cyclase
VRRLQAQVEGSTQEIVELREKLEVSRKEALTDALTGLANRKCFDERLLAASKTADDDGEPLCLVLADIDSFKQLNDRFGHGFGDQVLKLVAHTLVQGIKGRDTAARFGGEEFALILPNTPLQGAVTVAENMRKAIAAKKLARKGESKTIGTVTLSFGVTQYGPGEPLDILVRRADELLYRAKRLGRNRVIAEAGPVSIAKAG